MARMSESFESASTTSLGGIGLSNPIGVTVPSVIDNSIRPFDISETSLRAAEAKGNKRGDILTAYETYISGSPVSDNRGRGGQYAVSAQKQYGYASIRDAAAGYLQAAGLTFLADIVSPTPTPPTIPTTPVTPTTPDEPATPVNQPQNPFEILADLLPNLFGQSVYNPPLQSQSYGYTPSTAFDTGSSAGGSSLKSWLIIGAIVVIGYFLYKRYAG